MSVKLLVCEDDRSVADLISLAANMNWPNCEVSIAADGADAIKQFHRVQPDIVVLDVQVPPPDGFQICRQIRQICDTPILMLTARDAITDKLRAFDMGADDYLTKPFDALELVARMRALVRRNSHAAVDAVPANTTMPNIVLGDFSLNTTTHEVRVGGQLVHLTSTEYKLLEEMVRHAGTVLPHDMLLQRVWGAEYEGEEHYLKVFVRRLRRKLGDNTKEPRYIQTEWGIGYRFVPQA